MTDREREYAALGFEYAEGIERAKVVTLTTGREVRKVEKTNADGTPAPPMWEVQPHGDNYWVSFWHLLDAIKCGTRPKVTK